MYSVYADNQKLDIKFSINLVPIFICLKFYICRDGMEMNQNESKCMKIYNGNAIHDIKTAFRYI